MKFLLKSQQTIINGLTKIILFIYSIFFSVVAFAQEEGGDLDVNVDIGADGGNAAWYSAWWVWIVGIALFIIIIVAIVSAGRSRER